MPRGKTEIALICNERKRSTTYAKRKEGLLKKGRQLATLCNVPVAVVCAGPDGGSPDVWTTPPDDKGISVIDKYLALPAEKRAKHTHVNYLREMLGKEKAKLAKLQQDGPDELAPPKTVLDRMSQDELQQLLGSIDATLQATAQRREALELLATAAAGGGSDSGGDRREADVPWPVHHGVPCTGTSSAGVHGYQYQVHATWNPFQQQYNAGVTLTQPGYNNVQYMGGHGVVDMNGYQMQMQMPNNGSNNHGQLAWGSFQPCNAATVQPVYGQLQCWDNNNGGGVGYQIQPAPVTNADWHNPGAWDNAGEPCNAIVPSADPYMDDIGGNYVDTTVSDYQTTTSTSDNFMEAPIQYLAMGSDESFTNAAGSDEMQFSLDELLQCSDTTQNSPVLEQLHYLSDVDEQLQCNDATQNSPVLEQLHYLSDMADGFDFGSNFGFDEPLDLRWELDD